MEAQSIYAMWWSGFLAYPAYSAPAILMLFPPTYLSIRYRVFWGWLCSVGMTIGLFALSVLMVIILATIEGTPRSEMTWVVGYGWLVACGVMIFWAPLQLLLFLLVYVVRQVARMRA